MSAQAGLSFEQAPPFALPLRYFLTAPLFLLGGAILIAFSPEAMSARWTPQALALTHALTLGFLGLVMLGALMQMLPVLAGAPLPAQRTVSPIVHVSLTLGTLALMGGFLYTSRPAFGVGMFLLACGFAVFIAAAAASLARSSSGVTVNGMRLALASLAATVLLGMSLALLRAGWWPFPMADAATAAHVGFGLLGWVLLLVIGIAYQVVPMFQITPPYPPLLSRWLAGTLFALLLLRAVAPQRAEAYVHAVDAALALCMLLFAFATLRLQARRRRKLPDITLDFWRLGMASLSACVLAWITARFWPAWASSNAYPVLLGVLFIGGFAVSVVNGMLYKIVPFLAWFHLQAQLQAKAGTIPNMKQMIDERRMRIQFHLYLASCVLMLAAAVRPRPFAALAGAVLTMSTLLLWFNLMSAVRLFTRHGGRLD